MSCVQISEPYAPYISLMTGVTWLQLVCPTVIAELEVRVWPLPSFSEPLDFVHIYDATTFEQSQVIDFFGEIAGVCKYFDENEKVHLCG